MKSIIVTYMLVLITQSCTLAAETNCVVKMNNGDEISLSKGFDTETTEQIIDFFFKGSSLLSLRFDVSDSWDECIVADLDGDGESEVVFISGDEGFFSLDIIAFSKDRYGYTAKRACQTLMLDVAEYGVEGISDRHAVLDKDEKGYFLILFTKGYFIDTEIYIRYNLETQSYIVWNKLGYNP